jgi:membrane associated rhomboid family serine protease
MLPLPPVTKFLLLLCTAVFCLQLLHVVPLEMWFALWPMGSGRFMPWQVVTYAFLHGGFAHLFFNGLGLWMFGTELELLWGRKRYIQFIAVGILSAAAAQLLLELLVGLAGPTIGISGAVYALLVGFGMMFPERQVIIFPVPFPLKAKFLVLIVALMELFVNSGAGIAHFAHLGGGIGGFLLLQFWRGRPPFGSGRRGGGPRRLH